MKTRKKPLLLVVGDGGVATGFSRVIKSALSPLIDFFEIHHLAISYTGDPHDYPWKLYPAYVGGDVWGIQRIRSMVEKLNPDLIFMVNTFPTVGKYLEQLKQAQYSARKIAYCLLEGGPMIREAVEAI